MTFRTGLTAGLCLIASACAPSKDEVELAFSDKALETRKLMFDHVASLRADPANPEALGWWNQMTAAAGREDLLANMAGVYDDPSRLICSGGNGGDAADRISQIAAERTVVIINEHHAMPSHREFIRQLVVRLRAEGFTHYAAETLSAQGARGSGYPTTGDGWYTTEPLMARLLYEVRALGYTQVAYEQTDSQRAPDGADAQTRIDTREDAQVQNLQDAVFQKNPETKIIIHVGHSHVAEVPVHGTEWMAARLKKATGIDPLTLSLTSCRSDGDTAVLGTSATNAKGESQQVYTDYVVGLPSSYLVSGRPSYRVDMGDIAVPVPPALRSSSEAIMIEARPLGAPLEQEPVERLYLGPDDTQDLMLPVGAWSLISFTQDGKILATEDVRAGK